MIRIVLSKTLKYFLLCSASLILIVPAHAEVLNAAVASNFSYTLKLLSADFEVQTGHRLRIISASTGKLYAQIQHGAPFDVFLAADEKRPDLLLSEKKAVQISAYVYARGRIVLVSNIYPGTFRVGNRACYDVLTSTELKRLSIANPKTAPYGLAAKQILQKLELWKPLQSRLVRGENAAQALQFFSTKNAGAGFIASSMLGMNKNIEYACVWDVPVELYDPINQKMVVLNRARDKPAAQAFLRYIKSANAKAIIKSTGYDVP